MEKKKRYRRNKTKFWTLWAILFAVVMIVFTIANVITVSFASIINTTLNVSTTKITGKDDTSSSNYEFTEAGEQKLASDNEALYAEIVKEGATLVKNNNEALPLKSGEKVSVFGVAQNTELDLVNGLSNDGITVNQGLRDKIAGLAEKYTPIQGTKANEIKWDDVKDEAGSGDAAIVVLSRQTGEGSDATSDPMADYLALSQEEQDELVQLTNMKADGTFKKLIVVVASSNSIDSEFLQDGNALGIDVDAVVWVGMGSYPEYGAQAIADLMTAKDGLDFSGRLVDTFYVDNQLMPEMANAIAMNANTQQADRDLIQDVMEDQGKWAGAQGNYWRTSISYAEGIYHSYRYYETRYEDYILNGNEHGAYDGWSYDGYVAAPFGTGLHYNTGIEYTGFKVEENDADNTFDVTVTVKNNGATDVRHSVPIYMQTPYSDRDQELGIEEGSIKIVGYEKEDIPVGQSVDVTVSVDQTEMASYDEYESKTYIRDEGTYFLTTGNSVHEAMNNILAAKTAENEEAQARMAEFGEAGNSALVWQQDYTFDDQIFAQSEITGFEITNQFDNWDLNKNEDAIEAGNSITYLSRTDWNGTFPKAVVIKMNDAMVEEARPQTYKPDETAIAETPMPVTGKDNGKDTITAVNLIGKDYDDPLWSDFMDQLTVDQLVEEVSVADNIAIDSLLIPKTRDLDGPTSTGSTTNNGINPVGSTSEDLRAATFNKILLEQVGQQMFGENLIHSAGDTVVGWWGPGMNIHRTPYGGRNYSYYSEDPYVTGMSAAAEIKGCQNVNARAVGKHFVLNDQEANRHGVSEWANEQTIREIYMDQFRLAAQYGGLESVMTSFNRGGMVWTGQDSNLLLNVARGEFGLDGMIITDMYETDYEDAVDGIIGGNTRWLSRSTSSNINDPIQERIDAGDTVFMTALRDAAQRNLWQVVQSFAYDGFNENTQIQVLTPWWQMAIRSVMGVSAALMVLSIVMAVRSYNRKKKVRV